jgi:hypothetical protein
MTSVMPIHPARGGLLASRPASSQQLASQRQARRQRASVRRAREHRLHAAGAVIAGAVLAGVLACGLYFEVMSPTSQHLTVDKPKAGSFEQTRTGHVYVPVDGGFCKSLQFNNQTGEFNDTGLVACDDATTVAVASQQMHGTTYTTFTESFKKR